MIEETRTISKTLKRFLILVSSELEPIKNEHDDLRKAANAVMLAASKIEDYLRATE